MLILVPVVGGEWILLPVSLVAMELGRRTLQWLKKRDVNAEAGAVLHNPKLGTFAAFIRFKIGKRE